MEWKVQGRIRRRNLLFCIDLTRMECKAITGGGWQMKIYRIDLTRMECKAKNTMSTALSATSIDLTRMECKGI